jgi:putative peptidoglycan lipid II flippase
MSVPADHTMDPTSTKPPAARDRGPGQGIARGAAIIAALTVLSRILGLTRTLVFSQSIGAGCLGTAYTTANQVPSLIYEVAIGGALTSAMVPVLARSAERAAGPGSAKTGSGGGGDPEALLRVERITSALLTWAVLILVPLTVVIAVAAGPVAALLNPVNPNAHCPHPQMIAQTSRLLVMFAPQVFLYGVSVVLFGLLQAYRRFTGPALAPVIANVVLISCYLAFIPIDGGRNFLETPEAATLLLGFGTTANIAALVLVPAVPAWRLRLRLRPALRFPPGVARQAGGLVLVGLVEFVAQDVLNVIIIAVANGHGDTGALVLANYTMQVFNAMYGVLAVSIVTSVFPVLSSREGDAFDRVSAGSTRAVLLVSWLGTALIVAIAYPAANVLAQQENQVPQLVWAFALTAPAVAGMGVVTNLSRVMFVLGRLKLAAVALTAISVVALALDLLVPFLLPPSWVVPGITAASTIAATVVAFPVVRAIRRIRGPAAVAGAARANLTGITSAIAASAAGVAVSLAIPADRRLVYGGAAVLAALAATAVFAAVAFALDKEDLRAIARRARRYRRPLSVTDHGASPRPGRLGPTRPASPLPAVPAWLAWRR